MRKRRLLGSTTAIIVAATVLVQTTSVHAAEDFFTCDEIYENDSEVFFGYDDTQELVVEDDDQTFGDDEEDSGYEISEDEETEITDESEVVIDEGPSEFDLWGDDFEDVEYAEDVEIVEDAIEFDSEDVSENDSSGNDSCEADISANDLTSEESGEDVVNVTAIGAHVSTVTIKCGIAKSSEKAEKYGIKFQKDDAVKSAIFTLGTDYTSMKLTAALKDKDGKELNYTPTWKSGNEKVVAVSASGLNATIKAVGVGKATIICTAGDGSKKTAKVVITVKQGVTDLEITGQTYIAAGKNASYKTIAYPKKASNKKVTWSLKKDIPGVSVNPSSGKVSVTKDVAKGTKVVIIATAKDCSGVYTEKEITVRERATKVTLSTPSTTTIATHAVGDLKNSVSFEASTDNDETVSWKVSNDKIANLSIKGNKATLTALAAGNVTVTAFANDGSGKKATAKIKMVIPVSDLEITGQTYIQAGRRASYKTIAYPKKASNKKVTWSLKKDIPGVSVNQSSGVVSVAKDVPRDTKVTIVSTAKDCSGVYTEKEITVRERATKVTLSTPSTTTIATHAVGDLKDSVSFEASTDNDETVSWKVSNDKIANLSIKGNKATLTALAAGNVTVTAFANDGSGKKATAKIKMVIPVSDLSLSVPIDRQDDKLASGGSLEFTPVIGNKYGKPSNSKIRWEYEFVGYTFYGKEKDISEEAMQLLQKKKYVFAFSNGKITAVAQKEFEKQAAILECKGGPYDYGIKVTAYTMDGSNIKSETKLVKRVDRNTYMRLTRGDNYSVHAGYDYPYDCILLSEHGQNRLYIYNSNEDVASLTVDSDDYVHIHGKKKGTTTVTIKAMDGSGLSVKVTIKVI